MLKNGNTQFGNHPLRQTSAQNTVKCKRLQLLKLIAELHV